MGKWGWLCKMKYLSNPRSAVFQSNHAIRLSTACNRKGKKGSTLLVIRIKPLIDFSLGLFGIKPYKIFKATQCCRCWMRMCYSHESREAFRKLNVYIARKPLKGLYNRNVFSIIQSDRLSASVAGRLKFRNSSQLSGRFQNAS